MNKQMSRRLSSVIDLEEAMNQFSLSREEVPDIQLSKLQIQAKFVKAWSLLILLGNLIHI